jgi:hypothetical protein
MSAATPTLPDARSSATPVATGRGGALPAPGEVGAAVRETVFLMRLRWRFMRTRKNRALFLLAGLAFFFATFTAAQAGTMVRRTAEQGIDSPSGAFAINYIILLNKGELGALGATVIGSVFFIAVINPFLGASVQALFPVDDLAGLRPSRLHRYFASLVANVVTVGGLFQLIMLTVLGSLLTLDGQRTGGLLFLWSMWPVGILLATLVAWTVEWIQRRYGHRTRLCIGAILGAVLGTALALDPNHGSTLFGLGNTVVASVRSAAVGNTTVVAYSLACASLAAVVLFVAGMVACRSALALPDVTPPATRARGRLIPMSQHPTLALIQTVVAQVHRTPSIRRAMRTVIVLGGVAVWVAQTENLLMTLVVAVPLMMALDFGSNAFGILGPAMPWLASQPNAMKRLFWIVAGTQVGVTVTIGLLLVVPPALAGKFTGEQIVDLCAGFLVSTVLMSRSAMHKSINAPALVRTGRSDPALPPTRLVNYALRYVCWSGVGAVIVMGAPTRTQVALVALVVCWSLLRYVRLSQRWRHPATQAAIIAQVAAA